MENLKNLLVAIIALAIIFFFIVTPIVIAVMIIKWLIRKISGKPKNTGEYHYKSPKRYDDIRRPDLYRAEYHQKEWGKYNKNKHQEYQNTPHNESTYSKEESPGANHYSQENNQTVDENTSDTVDYTHSYQAKLLLTRNEWYEYKKLKKFTDERNLHICPKVRLLDIVEPKNGKGYMGALGKIKSKHVDFVITDQDLRIKGIIELDDRSHDTPDRIERDNFVDAVLMNVGYKIVHTRSITEQTIIELLN